MPDQHNGHSICKSIKIAYLHADSIGYGWGAVLNDNPNFQARERLWYDDDRQQHITWKELRSVRLAIESFLPQLRGRNVLLPKDNTHVVATLTKLTTIISMVSRLPLNFYFYLTNRRFFQYR
jgi:hypothetical protein